MSNNKYPGLTKMYGTYYNRADLFFSDLVSWGIFQKLLNEHCVKIRRLQDTTISLSKADIENKYHLDARTFDARLDSIKELGFIKWGLVGQGKGRKRVVSVNTNIYLSVINVINQLPEENAICSFKEAFLNDDKSLLEAFNYVEVDNGDELLEGLRASLNAKMYDKSSDDEYVQKCTINQDLKDDISEYVQKCMINPFYQAKMYDKLFIEQKCAINEIYRTKMYDISEIRAKMCDKNEIKRFIFEFIVQKCTINDVESIKEEVERCLDGDQDVNPDILSLVLSIKTNYIVHFCSEYVQKCSEYVQKCTIYGGINNINNKIKEIYKENQEEDVLSGKNQSFSEDSSLTHPDSSIISQDNQEEFADLNFCKEITTLQSSTSSYQDLKRKSRLPFFPVEEIQNIISDLSLCIDRPDKIFINQVWENLLPCFVSECEDETGNIEEKDQDPEGMPFYADRIIQDIIMPAFERTQEIISEGKVKINGTELPVTDQVLSPEDVEQIIDFKLTNKDGDQVYIISKKSFRNIYEKEIPVVTKKNVRDGREQDQQYMKDIILIGDDDERYKDLTPIELVIYNFLSEYFSINDNGEIDEPKQKFVNRVQLGKFYVTVIEKGLTEKDFLDVLFKNSTSKQDGSLQLKNRMFDSDKIKEKNEFRGYKSLIASQNKQAIIKDGKVSKN